MNPTGYFLLILTAGGGAATPIVPDVTLTVAPRSTLLVVENRPTTLTVNPGRTSQ